MTRPVHGSRSVDTALPFSSFSSGKGASAAAGFNEAREDVVRSKYRDLSTSLEEDVCRVSAGEIPGWSTSSVYSRDRYP